MFSRFALLISLRKWRERTPMWSSRKVNYGVCRNFSNNLLKDYRLLDDQLNEEVLRGINQSSGREIVQRTLTHHFVDIKYVRANKNVGNSAYRVSTKYETARSQIPVAKMDIAAVDKELRSVKSFSTTSPVL